MPSHALTPGMDGAMDDFLRQLLATEGYHPHGFCYLWQPGLIWLHVVADVLIGLAYVAIGMALALFVRRGRGELPFSRMFVAFGVFIAACGATHFVEVWTLWTPAYWFAGGVKVVTAAASVFTAIALPPLVPIALGTLRSARLSESRRVELEEAHARLKEADELKTQFFANVSHELRTPLTLILGPVRQRLAAADLGEEERAALETVQRNAAVLLDHVNDLLDVARLEAGQMEADYQRADLARLLRLVASHFESATQTRGVAQRVEAPETLPAEIDPDKIQRVLFNLLGNAVKFTPPGGRIELMLRRDPPLGLEDAPDSGRARIEVHDSGPGIPAHQREVIFEPFRQGDGGPARRYGGTGLGLAIVSDFVELHGGSVRVEESPLGGAAFVVELPLRAAPGVAVREEAEGIAPERAGVAVGLAVEAAPEAEREPELIGPEHAPLVLVVEDNAEMNRFLAETLAPDHRVARAHDGAEGVRRAAELRPDLIISDIMMPRLTGEDLVRRVRENRALDTVPIVLLSARADDELRSRLLREGAQDYLTKPFSVEELRARVSIWVGMRRARAVLQRELDTTLGDVEELAGSLAARKNELEIALQAARLATEEAEAANLAKANFLSVMSHELRTPLNAIMGYVDLIDAGIAGSLTEVQERYITRVKQSADHLLHLVDEVLMFARLEAGRASIHLERVDLRGVVQEVVEMVTPEALRKGLDLRVDVPAEPLRIETDPARVRQILLNLVGNATKFTERGSVTIEARLSDGAALLGVRDTGPGIPEEAQESIFEPFWQADTSKTRSAGGTGLGLAIVRRLTEVLGGEITVESAPGAGTTVLVSLPTAPPAGPGADG